MGGFSAFHWLIVLAIVLLLFGNRLPSVMRNLGRGVTEFKKGIEGVKEDDDEEEEVRPKKKKTVESTNGDGEVKVKKEEKVVE